MRRVHDEFTRLVTVAIGMFLSVRHIQVISLRPG
jgi:hypothetical protein